MKSHVEVPSSALSVPSVSKYRLWSNSQGSSFKIFSIFFKTLFRLVWEYALV